MGSRRPYDFEASGVDPEFVALEGAELKLDIVFGHGVLACGSFDVCNRERLDVSLLRGRDTAERNLQSGIVGGTEEAVPVPPAEAIYLFRLGGGGQ